ncbi:MAG: hypothetical protein HKN16_09785 [Saprospiraceae bacterium]|nr:hypothetical protein [Saprospiraceae bacterium]
MKIQKPSLLLILAFAGSGLLAQSAQKTLVKSFNVDSVSQVNITVDGPVEVKSWKQKTVRVVMEISLFNRPESFLKGMISAGRYNLLSFTKSDVMTIIQPGVKKEVRLKDGQLQESFRYLVYAPEHIYVQVESEASSSTLPLDENLPQ